MSHLTPDEPVQIQIPARELFEVLHFYSPNDSTIQQQGQYKYLFMLMTLRF